MSAESDSYVSRAHRWLSSPLDDEAEEVSAAPGGPDGTPDANPPKPSDRAPELPPEPVTPAVNVDAASVGGDPGQAAPDTSGGPGGAASTAPSATLPTEEQAK